MSVSLTRPEAPQDEVSAYFFSDPLPDLDEADAHAFDELATASLWTPSFTAERLSNLGGPQRKVNPGMPAPVLVVERAQLPAPEPVEPPPTVPSPEERALTARRTTETAGQRSASPGLLVFAYVIAAVMVVLLIVLFGSRAG